MIEVVLMRNLLAIIMLLSSVGVYAQNKEFSQRNITKFGLRGNQQVSLTFDDGPSGSFEAGTTRKVLDAIKVYNDAGYNIQATFFVIGNKVKRNKSTIKLMHDQGHIIGNHTLSHPNLRNSTYSNIVNLFKELKNTHNIIFPFLPSVTDLSRKWYFRAPFGAWAAQRANTANSDSELKNYVGPIFWDVGGVLEYKNGTIYTAADWNCWSKKVAISECALGYMREIMRKDGGLVLLHDVRMKSAELTKYLLVGLTGRNLFDDTKYDYLLKYTKGKSYQFVSMDDIRALDQYDKR